MEDVFPVPHMEQVVGLCSVAARENTVAVTALYEGLTVTALQGRLQDLVNVDIQTLPPPAVVPVFTLVVALMLFLMFPLLHIDDVEPGGQHSPALLVQSENITATPAVSLLTHLKREQ